MALNASVIRRECELRPTSSTVIAREGGRSSIPETPAAKRPADPLRGAKSLEHIRFRLAFQQRREGNVP